MVFSRSLFFIILIVVTSNLSSQVLEFRDITPSWSYTFKEKSSEDTTNLITIFDIVEKNGKYIVAGASEEPSNFRDWYGVNLACLDHQGNEEWYTAYQTFANNDSIHVFFPNVEDVAFNSSEIQLFGYRRKHEWTDAPSTSDSWSVYGAEEMYPHDISIDFNTGVITDICAGNDTITIEGIHSYLPTFKNKLEKTIKIANDVHLRPDSSFVNEEFESTLGFNFYGYNNQCYFSESNPIDTILFLPDDTVGLLSIEAHPRRVQPNPNTLVANIWFERYSDDPKQYLMWMDISNINDIKLIEMQELLEYIPRSTDRWIFFEFQAENKQVILSHSYNSQEGETSYLLWLNNDREIKKVIAPCKIGDHLYQKMDLVHATDGELLCLGFPSRAPNRGYDLIRVSEDEDSLILIKSIVPQEDNIYYNYQAGTVSASREEIILGMYVFQYANNTIFNDRQEVHAFRLSELTNNTYSPHTSRQMNLYPNPATTITRFEDQLNLKSIMLTNVSGQQIPVQFEAGEDEINVSHMPAGIYFIHAQDRNGKWYQGKLIKQ